MVITMSKHTVDELLYAMNLSEKCDLLCGIDAWRTLSIPRLDIHSLKMSDGPSGVRGESFLGGNPSVSLPCQMAMAASWNQELVYKVGTLLAQECATKCVSLLLAPNANLVRHPTGGRCHEFFGEDPVLAGILAVQYVNGIQSQGIGATIKHFICNEHETARFRCSSEVDERTLREVYLVPFEHVVKHAHPWALMSSYNLVNGQRAIMQADLTSDIVRGEWQFNGVILSDWGAATSVNAILQDKLDLEMPGPAKILGKHLEGQVLAGSIPEESVDRAARRILLLVQKAGLIGEDKYTGQEEKASICTTHMRQSIREIATEGIVLLKNEKLLLPLSTAATENILCIGLNAITGHSGGNGSAGVRPIYNTTVVSSLEEKLGHPVSHLNGDGLESFRLLPLLPEDEKNLMKLEFKARTGQSAIINLPTSTWCSFIETSPLPEDLDYNLLATCTVKIKEQGNHTFSLCVLGPADLFLDGKKIIDAQNWRSYIPGPSLVGFGTTELKAEVYLSPGSYSLTLKMNSVKEESVFGDVVLGRLPSGELQPQLGFRIGLLQPQLSRRERIKQVAETAKQASVVILVMGLNSEWESEGSDRLNMSLPPGQDELVRTVLESNTKTVVIIQSGTPCILPWIHEATTLLQVFNPGQESGNAVVDVLLGDSNPSGHLPISWPMVEQDAPAYEYFPVNGKILEKIEYAEKLDIGYRSYIKKQIKPAFAFGHGLSYSLFEIGNLTVSSNYVDANTDIKVSVQVTNISSRQGKEVVQIYMSPVAKLSTNDRKLVGFAKVDLLPSESKDVTIVLKPRHFAIFSVAKHNWIVIEGRYHVQVCKNADCIVSSVQVCVNHTFDLRTEAEVM